VVWTMPSTLTIREIKDAEKLSLVGNRLVSTRSWINLSRKDIPCNR
jgi:hypothetical protein